MPTYNNTCWCPACGESVETTTRNYTSTGTTTKTVQVHNHFGQSVGYAHVSVPYVRHHRETLCNKCGNRIPDVNAVTQEDYWRRKSKFRIFILLMIPSPILSLLLMVLSIKLNLGGGKISLANFILFSGIWLFPGIWGLLIRAKMLKRDSDLVSKAAAFFLPLVWYAGFMFLVGAVRPLEKLLGNLLLPILK